MSTGELEIDSKPALLVMHCNWEAAFRTTSGTQEIGRTFLQLCLLLLLRRMWRH